MVKVPSSLLSQISFDRDIRLNDIVGATYEIFADLQRLDTL